MRIQGSYVMKRSQKPLFSCNTQENKKTSEYSNTRYEITIKIVTLINLGTRQMETD